MNQEVFFQELRRVLQREGFTTQAVQDGLLPVEWDGHPLCRITEGGGVRYWQENVANLEREQACQRAADLACMVREYTRARHGAGHRRSIRPLPPLHPQRHQVQNGG